jgi:hypothetical protein
MQIGWGSESQLAVEFKQETVLYPASYFGDFVHLEILSKL